MKFFGGDKKTLLWKKKSREQELEACGLGV